MNWGLGFRDKALSKLELGFWGILYENLCGLRNSTGNPSEFCGCNVGFRVAPACTARAWGRVLGLGLKTDGVGGAAFVARLRREVHG